MTEFEIYRAYLKQILGGGSLITSFEFNDTVYDTTKEVKKAVANLRKYIIQGSWTKNKFQRFVILNLNRTSEETARLYTEKSYKASSTRTLRTRGINKLMTVIPCEFLATLVSTTDNPKKDYDLQCKACSYLNYLANINLTLDSFSDEYKKATQFITESATPCKVSECDKELNFIALYYMGYANLLSKLDKGKLLYINSLLEKGMSAGIDEDAALILVTLVEKIRKQYREVFSDDRLNNI